MKKVSLVALLATTFGIAEAYADAPANCPKAFQGFFLGGNAGLGLGVGKQIVTTSNSEETRVPVTENTDSIRNRLGLLGFDGGLNTGYNHRFGNFGLGLEFVANWTNSKGSVSTSNNGTPASGITSKALLHNSLQLRGNFSYVIANLVAPKLILGWDASRFKTSTVLTNFGTVDAGDNAVSFASSKSKYLNGFLIGLGVDFLATRHFIIGMDATVSIFNSAKLNKTFTNPAAAVALGAFNSVTQNTSFKPRPYGKISVKAVFIY